LAYSIIMTKNEKIAAQAIALVKAREEWTQERRIYEEQIADLTLNLKNKAAQEELVWAKLNRAEAELKKRAL